MRCWSEKSTIAVVLTVLFWAGSAHAQTVGNIAARGKCSTAGVEPISRQLVEFHLCLFPDSVVDYSDHPSISVTSDRVHTLSTVQTRDALHAAASQLPLRVNSGFRVLTEQFVLYKSGACGAAARPGSSNHQSGKAVDLANWSAARSAMQGSGCAHSLPVNDPVHFDCPGADMRSASILVFQKLWNLHNPNDQIEEDSSYGPQTEARLAATPAAGFPSNGCDLLDTGSNFSPSDWTYDVVSTSYADGEVISMAPGDMQSVSIELRNSGKQTWNQDVVLGPTEPRGRESFFVASDWVSPSEVVSMPTVVTSGETIRLDFTLEAPEDPGEYRESFSLRHAQGWFSETGGSPDNAITINVDVAEGLEREPLEVSGCAVSSEGSGAPRAVWIPALLVLIALVSRRRRRIA